MPMTISSAAPLADRLTHSNLKVLLIDKAESEIQKGGLSVCRDDNEY
jgi:hypothetical protein